MKKCFELIWILLVSMGVTGCSLPWGKDIVWYEKSPVVCHALGMTEEGDTLTNSKEALEHNYDLGQRVFEVDLAITADEVVVLRHDWVSPLGQAEALGWTEEKKEVPVAEEFLAAPIYGKYTPMTLLDLYQHMAEKEDMYVVLDPKYHADVNYQYGLIVNTAIDNGYEEVLDRVIPQIYYEEMYDEVEKIYSFEEYIYTVYYIGYPGAEEVGSFCQEKGISVLVMPYTWFGTAVAEELAEYPLQVYVHTVDEIEEAERMISYGADGLYSDCILPAAVEEMKR